MKKHTGFMTIIVICSVLLNCALAQKAGDREPCVWRPLSPVQALGVLAERVNLWREGRLWHMLDAEDGYLLSGFETRPGRHPWQGEHVGKWLHAATLAYEQTHDKRLLRALQETVERLLASQECNGYLGTYAQDKRFYTTPADKRNWDTWTFRYNLYGLLTYERYHPDVRVVEACKKMADQLIEVYGQGKNDLTQYGTRQGISATTLLESIVLLYERTREKKYLDFAQHIVAMTEHNPKLRLMDAMLKNESVVYSGDGKAYQLMANLLGYARLYECTGQEKYLETVEHAWETITARHLYVTGGPWTRKMPYNGNNECFALSQDFAPSEAVVETCATTTWIQMNLHMLELTGQARYAAEAERALFNALIAAQCKEGIGWAYYTRANQGFQPFESKITCCASSGPRALEMFARHVIGQIDGGISLASLVPCKATLSDASGQARIKVTGHYPVDPSAEIHIEHATGKKFAMEFRDPWGARLAAVRINGKDVFVTKNDRGFYRLNRIWKTGDMIAIDFEYLLRSHVERPKDDDTWVAFTYGPWALAREFNRGEALTEPLLGKRLPASGMSQWLEPCPSGEGRLPAFQIKGTDIVLKPYFSTGSLDTGPQTYFRLVGLPMKEDS
jgi:DUF1680 family protein